LVDIHCGALELEANDLSGGVNSRVGASRRGHAHRGSEHTASAVFQHRLDRRSVGLDLPTAVLGALVLDGELDLHGRLRPARNQRSRSASSAICTAFTALPLRLLSKATQRLSALSVERSARTRLTTVASWPTASPTLKSTSSSAVVARMPGAARSSSSA